MRLINVRTFEFHDFLDPKACAYAIVSHRWTDEEVTYIEFPQSASRNRTGFGWTKIKHACKIAIDHKLEWVWMDTCCIDKTSSAELTEAINSMFHWYKMAKVCFVFLSDVHRLEQNHDVETKASTFRARKREVGLYEDNFKKSDWFSRGWTLQELLAPREVLFYNRDFNCIGSRAELSALVAAATGIQRLYVEQPLSSDVLQDLSIAERMRWASTRETTKEEDMAYCLLGIFDVNMPLLYGEGKKAFTRLQLELVKKSDDESIFAWDPYGSLNPSDGLLASTPAAFRSNGMMHDPMLFHYPHSMTNKGLQMTLDIPEEWTGLPKPLQRSERSNSGLSFDDRRYQKEHTTQFMLPLNCTTYTSNAKGQSEAHAVAIRFQATVLKANIAILGYREGRLELIPGSSADDWLPKSSEHGASTSAIVIGKARKTRPWTVYFPQKGL